jgi:hypothetical protein
MHWRVLAMMMMMMKFISQALRVLKWGGGNKWVRPLKPKGENDFRPTL